MKRLFVVLLTVLLIAGGFVLSVQADAVVGEATGVETETVVEDMEAQTIRVLVNGQRITFPDAQPYIDANGRTQVPTRFIGEALGAKVDWEDKAQRVTFSLETEEGLKEVEFRIDRVEYYIRVLEAGKVDQFVMDTKAVLENGRTFIPVRFAAEALGATVKWEEETQTVYIDSPTAPPPTPVGFTAEMFDEQGLYKAEYANEFYWAWFESLRFIYEWEKLYISYTVPEGFPEDTEFTMDLKIYTTNDYIGTARGVYHSRELVAGNKQQGMSYLLPNTAGIAVKKELDYIPVEYLHAFHIGCYFTTPVGSVWGKSNAFAQTCGSIFVYSDKKNGTSSCEIVLSISAKSVPEEYLGKVNIDPKNVIQIK